MSKVTCTLNVIQKLKKVLFIMPFLLENACSLTLVSTVVKRKSAHRAKGQKGDIWRNRLSKMILAQRLH